jgi:hypothetical protein
MARVKESGSHWWRASEAGCVAALMVFAGIGTAQTGPAASISNRAAAAAQGISYSDGELRINATNTNLAEVLGKIAALTGVTIEIPPGAGSEHMQVVELGPGPARQIVASLLSESNFDYLIQSSDNDPERIQSVLLMPRGKKDTTPGGIPASGRSFRDLYGRAATPPPPEEPAVIEPAPVVPQNLPAGLVPVDPQSPPALAVQPPPPDAQPALPSLPSQPPLEQPLAPGLNPDPSNRPGALIPPPVMNQQNPAVAADVPAEGTDLATGAPGEFTGKLIGAQIPRPEIVYPLT